MVDGWVFTGARSSRSVHVEGSSGAGFSEDDTGMDDGFSSVHVRAAVCELKQKALKPKYTATCVLCYPPPQTMCSCTGGIAVCLHSCVGE